MRDLVKNTTKTAVFALGGLGEVGKNMYCIEHGGSIIILDSGVMFGDEYLPGVDYILPDYSYLIEHADKVKALFITHGHEDHIGGIPFLLKSINIPCIYAPKLACAFIRNKLEEQKMERRTKIIEIDDNSVIKEDVFVVSFFSTTHSIPDSYGIIVNTPNGNVVSTGDFKIDLTPVGRDIDLLKITKLQETGVTLLLSESTNIEVKGHTLSEKAVISSIHDVFRNATGRIIIGTFSSNVHRIQQIIEAAVLFKRKILVFGRSMEKNIQLSRQLGYIKCPDNYFISPEMANTLRPDEILIFCTGTQGESMAALSRIAANQHKHVKPMPGDVVVFSSSAIPGNTANINKLINQLSRHGVTVLTNSVLSNLHTSGHAAREELKLMLKLIKPDYLMPIHGEYRMLRMHAELAQELGMKKDHTFVLANGDVLYIDKGVVELADARIQADDVYVDGHDINGISTAVIKDRKLLSNDGLVAILVSIDSKNNMLLTSPSVLSRGFIYIKENGQLIREIEKLADETLHELFSKGKVTFLEIKNTIRNTVSTFIYRKTRRNPMVIPVIMNKVEHNADNFSFVKKDAKKKKSAAQPSEEQE
jgi:ribonuclease J